MVGGAAAREGSTVTASEVVRDGDEHGVIDQADELGEGEEGTLLDGDAVGVKDLEGGAPQVHHRRVRHLLPQSFR